MKTTAKNYYFIGKVMGGHRTENLIQLLLNKQQPLYYNSLKNRNRLPGFLFSLFSKLSSLINIVLADVVIMPAMCNNFQFEFRIAVWLKKKIVTDFYVSFYDTHVLDKKPLPKGEIVNMDSSAASKLWHNDRKIIKNADFTFFLNSTEAKYYLQLLDLNYSSEEHFILPICTEEWQDCELNYYSNKNQRTFNICWWGTYIPLHGLEKIISAAQILKENYKLNFHFHLLGTNREKARPYLKLIQDLNLSNVVSIHNDKTFSNGKLEGFLLKNCDLVLGNFGDSEKAKNVIVNKIIDGIAMKAPVLTGESLAPKEFFSEDQIFYTRNVPEAMALSIYNIAQYDESAINERVSAAHLIFKEFFSIDAFNRKVESIFMNL
ncbi:hypothetical protein SAMN06296241_1878 [Salinimicrobium sediminis]|uniref:Uncharacterized protein n=1 Tax=Salinimicrobium sediminis TaxID=1343891 RepID=A0A285X4R1_9FLAO|nr:glycosyltransferase family 4 protein [Salinimicrobium sediminis]SOC80330.1 hypothetical protein SAMN06296241_1878 [Salinimicrobium sediminis]